MRLTPLQRQVFIQTARECFEPLAQVRLFGSRAVNSRKGGDIDLLIETQLQDPARIARAHTQFLSRVYLALGEQKIDVLIDYPGRQSQSPIYDLAKQGLLL
jgi:predicted nucleotidyltransferase